MRPDEQDAYNEGIDAVMEKIENAKTVDAVPIDRVLEIIAELKNENIGRDGSDEYTSACQDFRAAVVELEVGTE